MHPIAANVEEVTNALGTNMKPYPSFVGINQLFPRRRTDTLHAVIAAAEENRAESIDSEMYRSIQSLHPVAFPLKYYYTATMDTVFLHECNCR